MITKTNPPKWIEDQVISRGITEDRVISALQKVPRQEFVPLELRNKAYEDGPLPIGYDQTISQPYIVAYMSFLAELSKDQKVLEIGTGSAYQSAILGELVSEVYSIEIVEPLAIKAAATLEKLGYSNIYTKTGDGYLGWAQKAPFDVIILTASPPKVPEPLFQQLEINGRLIAPVGVNEQRIFRWTKLASENFHKDTFLPVSFVPMTGKAQGA
ncbi:MAG: protein-L-isoaspartate(D-aspartate) O-methyltransferase [Oligoflexales bacterium]